jgi:5-methylcytosine-specific restriction enzyme A
MRNPKWTRDELLLVLHLYLQNPKSPPSKQSKEVKEMSEILGRLGNKLGIDTDSKFRNINGVYMKMMNFLRFDGSYEGVGLTRGGKDEQVVWDLYSDKQQELSKIVKSIRELIDSDIELPPTTEESEEEDLEEGKLKTRLHKVRERSPNTVKKKKKNFLEQNGRLYCEVCGFDFVKEYGSRGDGFIECHHTKFLSDYDEPTKTSITDLVLLCSNCHRMIHRKKPWLSVDELKEVKGTVGE